MRRENILYSAFKIALYCLFKIFFRYKVIGAEHIPASGGVIIAANHISLWDPPLIGASFNRSIHFMAKEELFSNLIFKWVITKLQSFPVRRGAPDRTAIRYAINLLKNGEVLGVFPEGTRSRTGELGKPEAGIAMIACKARVPIVPAAIIGTNQVGKNGCILPQFIVKFGEPILISDEKADKEMMDNLSNTIMQAISGLLKEKG